VYICCVCVCVFSEEGTGLNRRRRGGNICVYMLFVYVFLDMLEVLE